MIRLASIVMLPWALSAVLLARDTSDRRVRATEPTVLTVEGAGDEVGSQVPQQQVNPGKLKRVRSGAAAAVKGLIDAAGWLLNTDEDLPARRDRNRSGPTRDKDTR